MNSGELMKQTDRSLLEQMKMSDFEVDYRKQLFTISSEDADTLLASKPIIESNIDALVNQFYEMQTSTPEIALLIGDADTLSRLRNAQRQYVLDLFSGVYDLDYVNNRLRIGLVHKRIGVEPKLYLSAIYSLKSLLQHYLQSKHTDQKLYEETMTALTKLFMFDIALVFDTYIRSLVSEIEASREKSEQYALSLEEKVRERTEQLEEMSRTDALTGLLNSRHMNEILTTSIRRAQRRQEPISLVYMDINDFKQINDTQGHQRGDEVLKAVAKVITSVSRDEDHCFRYGGDEFCVVLPNCGETHAHELYVARLNKELQQTIPGVTLSTGIIETGPIDYLEATSLMRNADERMYAAKKSAKKNQGA